MNTLRPHPSGLPRNRRRISVIAALGLTTSLMAAPATAAPTPTPTSPAAAPTTAPNPADAAKQEAKKQNKRIEIPSYRAETSTTFANPDGKTLYTELHSTPIRVQKDGTWQPVDTTLVEEGGAIRPKAVKGEFTLSAGGDTTLLKTTNDRGQAALSATAKLPRPHLAGDTATYPSAYGPGVDLVVTATPTGLRQKLVIRERPTSKKKLSLRIPVDLPQGMRYGKDPSGKPALLASKADKTSKADKKVASITGAPILDAAAIQRPETGHTGTATTTTEQNGDDSALLLTPDTAFLADPAVTYPVTVALASDTWTGTGIAGDTFVSTGYPNGNSNNINYQRIIAGKSNNGTATWRGYIDFTIKGTPLEGGTVHNADLRLWNFRANACTSEINSGIVARRITGDWTVGNLTWNNQPSVTTGGQAGNKGAYSDDCPRGEGELYHSIETMVQAWMDGTADHGVQLSSASESDNTNWRWYRSYEYGDWGSGSPRGPVLFIEYTPTPQPTKYLLTPALPDGSPNNAPYDQALAMVAPNLFSGENPVVQAISEEEAENQASDSQTTYGVPVEDVKPPPWATEEQITEATDPNGPPNLNPASPVPTPTPSADSIPPEIDEVTPTANAVEVATNVDITVNFDEEVDNGSLTLKDSQGNIVQGKLDAPGLLDDPFVIFTPDQPLAVSSTYTAEISGFSDATGNVISPYLWTFTTATTEAPVPPPPTFPPTVPTPVPPPPTPTPMPGLIAAYGMEEGSGATVSDSSGQNNTGLAGDTSWSTTGKFGKALSFNGANSLVTINDAPSLRLSNTMTLSAWVNPSTLTGWRTVVMKDLSFGNGAPYGLYASNGYVPTGWLLTTQAEPVIPKGTSALPTNTWSHVALTYDGAIAQLYVNGTQVGQVAVTGDFYDDGGSVHIGGNSVWGEFFDGLIDEVRIYNTAQTAAQIQTDMNTPVGSATPPVAPLRTRIGQSTTTAPSITKLAVSDSTSVNDKTSTTTVTPRFTAWIRDSQHRTMNTEIQVIEAPTKSSRGRGLIWSGKTADSVKEVRASLRVPVGKLRNGQHVRWRARATATGAIGDWSPWQDLYVNTSEPDSSVKPTTSPQVSLVNTAVAAAGEPERFGLEECQNTARSKLGLSGFAKNRYSSCYWHYHDYGAYDGRTREKIGYLRFRVTIFGWLYPNTREFKYTAVVDDFRESNAPGAWAHRMKVGFTAGDDQAAPDQKADCKPSPNNNNKMVTFTQWKADGVASEGRFTSPAASATKGNEQRDYCLIKTWLYFPDRDINNAGFTLESEPVVRCDSAAYLSFSAGGCVFPWSVPHLNVKLSQKWYEQVVHIWRALKHPNTATWPKTIGRQTLNKDIPGGMISKRITRTADEGAKNRNHSRSARTCVRVWGGSYAAMYAKTHPKPDGTPGNMGNCDEFPFQSTREGSAHRDPTTKKFTNNFSVFVIDGPLNQLWGTAVLNVWYCNERIVDGDKFWINLQDFPN